LSRQDVIEHTTGTAELPRELRLRDSGLDSVPGAGDLLWGELAGPTSVDTLGFGALDALALALPNQGTLELGDGTEQVQLERSEGIVGAEVEAQALGDELDSDPRLVISWTSWARSTTERARRSIEATPDDLPAADVAQHRRQGRPVAAALTADPVGERLLHLAERSDLASGVLLDAAHPHIPNNLT